MTDQDFAPDAGACPAPESSSTTAEPLTLDDVRAEIVSASAASGLPAAVLLASFGASRLSDVQPADLHRLVVAVRAAGAKGKADAGSNVLDRIAASLDRIAAALESRSPPAPIPTAFPPIDAPADPAPAAEAAGIPAALTLDAVRRELIAATAAGTPAAVLLAGIGAKRLSDVSPNVWPALVAAARAVVAASRGGN